MTDQPDGTAALEADAADIEAAALEQEETEARDRADALRRKREELTGRLTAHHAERDGTTHEVIEVDESGAVREPGTGLTKWEHRTMEYEGETWEVREPKTAAQMFLSVLARKAANPKLKGDAFMGFLEHTLSQSSFERVIERSMDHDDTFDIAEVSNMVTAIIESTTKRKVTPPR